jgi:hypothetical protein
VPVALLVQSTHAPPLEPHTLGALPITHAAPLQQPPLHARPPAQLGWH